MSEQDPKGYYSALGVSPTADADEIKKSFRKKAMDCHPDRNASADATRQFQLINEAYKILSDPASRAQYDTMSINSGRSAQGENGEVPDPIVCSCCGKVTAQPRYAIFFEVKSFLVVTTKSVIQGIFCSSCAEKKALKASAISWLLGWWGFPWGPIYVIQSLITNMLGGKQPANINARLAAHQAWVFATRGNMDMARAIALDAMVLAKKIKPDTAMARVRKSLGYEVEDEGGELRAQIQTLLDAIGRAGGHGQLRDAWTLFRRPFYIQIGFSGLVISAILWAIGFSSSGEKNPRRYTPDLSYTTPVGQSYSQPYLPPQTSKRKPVYERPTTAPNGSRWPLSASYVDGYSINHDTGLSTVTVDNSQNDSDVFVRLFTLDEPEPAAVRTFFIPAHGRFTVKDVTKGTYDVRYRDLDSGSLSRSESFALKETNTYEGTQFSNLTMTLYKVKHGNMQTYGLSEADFK